MHMTNTTTGNVRMDRPRCRTGHSLSLRREGNPEFAIRTSTLRALAQSVASWTSPLVDHPKVPSRRSVLRPILLLPFVDRCYARP